MAEILLRRVNPLARAFLDYAYLFEMADASPAIKEYLFSHYAGLCFVDPDACDVYDALDFFPGPRFRQFARSSVVDASEPDLWRHDDEAIKQFFTHQVMNGVYCVLPLDEYYLPATLSYGRMHFIHQRMVVGVDLERDAIALAGYFRLPGADYGLAWIDFDTFLRAFSFSCEQLLPSSGQESFAVGCYKRSFCFRPTEVPIGSDGIETAARSIETYLSARTTPELSLVHNKDLGKLPTAYGLEMYDAFIDYVGRFTDCARGAPMHAIRLFCEHKEIAVARWRYWVTRGLVRDTASVSTPLVAVARIAKLARMTAVPLLGKTEANRTISVDRIRRCLEECRDIERTAYQRMIAALEVPA